MNLYISNDTKLVKNSYNLNVLYNMFGYGENILSNPKELDVKYDLSSTFLTICNLLKIDVRTLYLYRQNICLSNYFKVMMICNEKLVWDSNNIIYDTEDIDNDIFDYVDIDMWYNYDLFKNITTNWKILDKLGIKAQNYYNKINDIITEQCAGDEEIFRDNRAILVDSITKSEDSSVYSSINRYQAAYYKVQGDYNDCVLIDFKSAYLSVLRKYKLNPYNVINIVTKSLISKQLYSKMRKISIDDDIDIITTNDEYNSINMFYDDLNNAINNAKNKNIKWVLKSLIVSMTGLFLKEGNEIYNPYLYYAMVMLLNFEIRKLL